MPGRVVECGSWDCCMSDACRHKKHHERDIAIAGDVIIVSRRALLTYSYDNFSIHQKKHHIVRNRLRTRVRRSVARSPTIQTMPSSAASSAGQSCRSSVVAEVICDEAHINVQVSVVSQLSSFTFFSSQICDRVDVVYHDSSPHPRSPQTRPCP